VRGGTGRLHRPSGLRLDLEPDRQHGRAHRLPAARQHDARPFNPDPDAYKPTSVTGQPAASYELALTNPDFKFPQTWRTNIAVDQKLPVGLIGTAEFLYSKDVNGIYYINANLAPANTAFVGADNRPRWTAGNRIHSNVSNAVVLKNQNVGRRGTSPPRWSGLPTGAAEGRLQLRRGEEHRRSGLHRLRVVEQQPARGRPEQPGPGFLGQLPGPPLLRRRSYRGEYLGFGATTFSLFSKGAPRATPATPSRAT
jgi:hypothetical protein